MSKFWGLVNFTRKFDSPGGHDGCSCIAALAASCGGSGYYLDHGLRRRGSRSGSVYVYNGEDTEWGDAGKLTAHDGREFDEFGTVVANDEGTIGVGADAEDGRGDHSRTAYVFGDSPRCKLLVGSSEQAILMSDLFERRKAVSTYGQLRSIFRSPQIARGRVSVRIAFAVIQATFRRAAFRRQLAMIVRAEVPQGARMNRS
jgi:hypothetical protein